ncbi:MAG: DUF4962 domain-containing protein [Bacteroidota bacterium]
MNKFLLPLLACASLMLSRAEAQPKIPYKLVNDFESGELYGWETYPYAQDIGFDALYFASKTPTHNNSKYALARPLKAHDTNELYQGFTKRLNFYTTADTRIKAAIYFQSDRNPESLELSLGTFEGARYMHTIDKPAANTWIELDLPISAFSIKGQALKPNEHIQVVTLKGSYSVVNYLFTYTILMDDFQINGERDRSFTASEPISTSFEMFDTSILNRHFFYGDNISLKVAPEGNISLKQAKGTLVDSKGNVVKDNLSLKQNGAIWESGSIYKVGAKDARGQWEFRVKGQDENGGELNQAFRFLVPGNKVSGHPRLFFSSEELKERLSNEKSSVAKGILKHALEEKNFMKVNVEAIKEGIDRTAENLVGGPYAKNSVGYNAYAEWNGPNATLGKVIEEGSFHYAFTGDKAAGEQAKKALLKLVSFSKWNSDWMLERKFWTYYPVGYAIKPVAYGYDMLYDLLTNDERALVRNAIVEKGLKLFHRDMVEMNRMPSGQTNHIAVIVAGFGIAATAIYGDDPSNPYLEPYLSGILAKTKTFIDRTYYEDGSYGEPKSGYMNMATKDIVEALAAFERNFGVDYTTTTALPNYYKYPLQASASNGLLQDFGDGGGPQGIGVAFGPQVHAQWLVNRTKNPYLYNFVKPYWESGKGGFLGYLWYRDDITPITRETLPSSKVFSAQGMVMRSGWDEPATIITTRVGPNSNHYHYDQGSFQILTNGEALLTDPGVGYLGYYANLDYLGYNVNSIAHNVMLIDHDPESQAPAHYDNGIKALTDWPRMVHTFNGENADALVSDLATVYKGKLDKYTRTLLYTKTGPIFLFDQVKSKSPKGHGYDWLFHAPANEGNASSITYKDRRMVIQRPNARLTMDVIAPDIANSRIRDRFSNKSYSESFLSLETKQDLTASNFLAVLLPEAKPAGGDYVSPTTTPIDLPGWQGAKIVHNMGSDIGLFKTALDAGTNAGDFTTDGERFTASFDKGGKFLKAYFEGSSFSGQGVSVKSTSPLTGTVLLSNNSTKMQLQSVNANTINIGLAEKPASVMVNGKTSSAWQYDQAGKSLTLKINKGMSDIAFMHGK